MMRPWSRTLVWVLGAAAISCVDVPPGETSASEDASDLGVQGSSLAIRVPGRWSPPPDVIARANAQFVEVVDPPPVYPLGHCSGPDLLRDYCTHPACSGPHPGTQAIADWIMAKWGATGISNLGVAGCRRNTNNGAYLSVHAIGRAIDIGVPLDGGDADNTIGDAVGNFLIERAQYIGIQRVGWDGRWFNGRNGFGANMCSSSCGVSDYPSGCWPCNPHVNHLHIEVSVDAGNQNTRFFTEGPPGETCPVVCYGSAAVAADCSFVDCAASGQVCVDGPVRCAPIEPPSATFNASAALPTVEPIGGIARFTFVGPARVFDTRMGADSSRLMRAGAGSLAVDAPATVTSWPLLPAGARGAWLNAAAVQGAGAGFLQVYPTGSTTGSSTLNYQLNAVRSNAAPVSFGTGDGVDFMANVSSTDLITDIVAAFTDEGLGLRSIAPRRVLDSRGGASVLAETEYPVGVEAPADARGVVATVAVLNDEPGFLTAYACGAPRPDTSSINYEGRGVVANTVVSELSADGKLCFWSKSPVDLVVDIAGYFVPDGELSYQPVHAVRLLDTRQVGARYEGRPAPRQLIELPIQSLPGAPAGIQSVVVNLTATGSDPAGFVTMFPCGFDAPVTSSLNFGSERGSVGTVGVTSIGDGSLCMQTHNRTHLVVDLLGVWVPTPGAAPTPSTPPVDPDPSISGMEDAGVGDAGVGGDGGPSGDAGPSTGGLNSGCSCRVTAAPSTPPLWAMALGVFAVGVVFGRRRRCR